MIRGCDILSPEFGWSTRGITMENTTAVSEYFMMRSEDLTFKGVTFKGKYSFQYIKMPYSRTACLKRRTPSGTVKISQ